MRRIRRSPAPAALVPMLERPRPRVAAPSASGAGMP